MIGNTIASSVLPIRMMILQCFVVLSIMMLSPPVIVINAWTSTSLLPMTTSTQQLLSSYHPIMEIMTKTRTRATILLSSRSSSSSSIGDDDNDDIQKKRQGKKETIDGNDDDDNNKTEKKKDGVGEFNWLEEWALEGAKKIGTVGIQERTQRVMLAQMTEDRIYEITNILESLIDEDTQKISEENIPKAKELAQQTRVLQKEYKDLVTGEPSTLIDTISNLKEK
jgi:hypothetical protein